MKIYTKTGDRGQTSLYGGKRVDKNDVCVEAYGTVDELNSAMGVAIAEMSNVKCQMSNDKDVKNILENIQSDLFFVGAMLAGDRREKEARSLKLEDRTKELEQMIDWMAEKMPPQKHFILPGGSKSSTYLHLARSICRRAERRVVTLKNLQPTTYNLQPILIYLNRLSDFLYMMAKWINFSLGIAETTWKPSP